MIVYRSHFQVCILFLFITYGLGKEPNITQPIQFNHKYHIEEVELECYDCHLMVEKHRRATIPNIDVCSDCHDDLDTDIEEAQKVADYIAEGKPIPWTQVHRVVDHAYFSHQRHVTLGEIDCSTCHGNVQEREVPFTKPHKEMTMDWCKSCHEENLITIDCNSCHR